MTQDEVKNVQLGLCRQGYLLKVDGDLGEKTKAAVRAFQSANWLPITGIPDDEMLKLLGAEAPTSSILIPATSSPWMDYLLKHEGEKEISGSKANPFIVDLFKYTTYETDSDETPWCAALANTALIVNGYKGTKSAAASSFDKLGTPCDLVYGCVVTLRHPNGGRHVTFFFGWAPNGQMICLGGNQGNKLCRAQYDKSELVAARWPIKAVA